MESTGRLVAIHCLHAEVLDADIGSCHVVTYLKPLKPPTNCKHCIGSCRTGKTQLCHTLCVTTQMPRETGGGAGKVNAPLLFADFFPVAVVVCHADRPTAGGLHRHRGDL